MPDVQVLEVRLHGDLVGTLTRVGGDRVLFAFEDSYRADADRVAAGAQHVEPGLGGDRMVAGDGAVPAHDERAVGADGGLRIGHGTAPDGSGRIGIGRMAGLELNLAGLFLGAFLAATVR